METNFARTFAALSATNEAILYAKSPEELYGKVCEAAFTSGDFMATAVFLLEPGTNMLRLAAGFGDCPATRPGTSKDTDPIIAIALADINHRELIRNLSFTYLV